MKNKTNKIISWVLIGITLLPIVLSIIVDLCTYNKIFPTSDPLWLYVWNGIVFNIDKCVPPLVMFLGVKLYESKIISTRQQNTKSSNNEN